jgi:hypothetical protein
MQLQKIALCFLLSAALPAWADDAAIGYVKTLSGEATVTTGTSKVAAQLGTPLYLGSQLKTGKKSSMGVTFKDDTVMSFGSDTDLTIDEYLYAPNQGKLKLGSKLAKGSMNYVSGVIAKLQPDAVSIKTPTGTIGVRGTQFVVLVEESATP